MARATYPRALLSLEVLLDDLRDGSDDTTHAFVVVPRDVEIERNHHREADTFRASIDWLDLPFDPRVVRSIRVRVWLGDVGEPNTELAFDAARNKAFIGFVDEPETTLEESGEVVRLSGRDYTSLFLDYKWPSTAVDLRKPLSAVVAEIVASVPGAASIPVAFSAGANNAIVANVYGKTRYSAQSGDDAWTVLVEICGILGLIPVFELDTLAVRAPNEIRGRTVAVMYGDNVSRLVYRRKFNETRTSQIRVVAWDDQARTRREAKWPKSTIVKKRKVGADGKVSTQLEPIVSWYVQGAYTPQDLERIAQSIYEDVARDQVDGTIETHAMRDITGNELWLLGNGDQISVELGTGDLASILAMSDSEAIRSLTSGPRPMDEGVARALIAANRRAERLATRFYVRKARHRWGRDDGYKLDVDYVTYVGNGGRS
jgi:hypothetical protein